MPFNRYETDPGGGFRFLDDSTGESALAFGPAASARALELDASTGATKPVEFYRSAALPRPMAASPAATADASGAVNAQLFGQPGATMPPNTPPVSVQAPEMSNPSGLPPMSAPPTLSAPAPARAVGAMGPSAGGDVGRVQGALGVAGVGGEAFMPPISAGAAGALALKENKGGVDPTTAKFQTFGAGGQGGGLQAPTKLGTGNPLLDELNARAMQPGRFVQTAGGWTPGSRTFKREATPDTEAFHRYGEKAQGLAALQAEGAQGRSENERKHADVLASLLPDERVRIEQTNRNIEIFRQRAAKAMADVDADRKLLSEAKVDPSRYFSSQSAGESILQIMSIVAGAFGQALTGGKTNIGIDMMARAVEQDIAAQRDNIEQGNKNLSASERRVDLESRELGSMEMALDLQRARAYQAAQTKAKQLEAEAKSDAERQSAREMIAAADAKLYELNMKFSAARNGDQIYSEHYRPGGVAQVGGMNDQKRIELAKLNIEQQKANASVAKDQRDSAPQTLVYGDKRIALRPEINATEGAKYRTAAGLLMAMRRNAKRIAELRTLRGKLSPEQTSELEGLIENMGADWSVAKGQGVVTNQQAERFESSLGGFLGGKGGVDALVGAVDATVDGIVRQAGAGYVNADGSVQPFSE